ncbi:hemolysin III family protein [Candidatus Saccharibacteria bacterium]|nr:hemolysin III family protein [Candidatus Saccharibacteria bacterium]
MKSKRLSLLKDSLKETFKKPDKPRKVSIPTYTKGEEIVSSISHGVGAGLAIAALVLMVLKAPTPHATVGVALYGAIMIILFTISCLYHALSPNLKGKKVLRVIDHINVMLMVAGTYLPICFSLLYGQLGWIIFGIVWGLTLPAVILNAIDVDRFQVVSTFHNLILGWGALFLLKPLRAVCPLAGIWLLIGGGICYTIGSILYGIGYNTKWFHSIFHFFVLGGATLHFFFIYLYCI